MPWEITAALTLYEIPFPEGNKVPDKILARIFSECIHNIYEPISYYILALYITKLNSSPRELMISLGQ